MTDIENAFRERRGWLADAGDHGWQPCLQLDGVCLPLDIWFETERACLDWIKSDVIGRGMWSEARTSCVSPTPIKHLIPGQGRGLTHDGLMADCTWAICQQVAAVEAAYQASRIKPEQVESP